MFSLKLQISDSTLSLPHTQHGHTHVLSDTGVASKSPVHYLNNKHNHGDTLPGISGKNALNLSLIL